MEAGVRRLGQVLVWVMRREKRKGARRGSATSMRSADSKGDSLVRTKASEEEGWAKGKRNKSNLDAGYRKAGFGKRLEQGKVG